MKLKDLEDLLKRITYKPEFQMICRIESCADLIDIRFSRMVKDATGMQKGYIPLYQIISFTGDALEHMDEKEMLMRIYNGLIEFEIHEMNEWLKVDGKCFKEPHPGYDLIIKDFKI